MPRPIETYGADCAIYRGDYPLPPASLERLRDLDAECIDKNPGGVAALICLTSGAFRLLTPNGGEFTWRRFDDERALWAFCEAYGITGTVPKPNNSSLMRLPVDDSAWVPIRLQPKGVVL
jgi:hypothetical protein